MTIEPLYKSFKCSVVSTIKCSICNSGNISHFVNLGEQPPANALASHKFAAIEAKKYDLSLQICNDCLYVRLNELISPVELFSQNTYLTGVSSETRSNMQDFANDCVIT